MKCRSGRTTGSCIPSCRHYGRCHCGCGRPSTIAHQNDREDGRRKGQPGMWLAGHSPGTLGALNRGYAGDRDIPVDEVMWMLDALLDHYGSVYRVAKVSGVNHASIHRLQQGRYARVRRITEHRLRRALERADAGLRRRVLPSENVIQFLGDRGLENVFGKSYEARAMSSRGMLSIAKADEIACRLGVHPSAIWPEWDRLEAS